MPTAPPVAVSTAVRTANVVTVTTAAPHGLIAGQGCALRNVTDPSFNGNFTLASAPTTTTFTFSQPSVNASSSGGSVLPAKQILLLEVSQGRDGHKSIRYLLWLTITIPVVRPISTTSAWPGASAEENAALVAGTTVERQKLEEFPNTLTKVEVQSFLQKDYTAEQNALSAATQPGAFFGIFFDGTGWS